MLWKWGTAPTVGSVSQTGTLGHTFLKSVVNFEHLYIVNFPKEVTKPHPPPSGSAFVTY